ncbi:MAG: uroporphyrinogen decarboxylase family protein [Massiliimalia sp.]
MSIAQMTNRERLIAALHSQEVDRLPYAPLIDPYFVNSLPKQGFEADFVKACRMIGNDIMERHVAGPSSVIKGLNIREEKSGNKTCKYFETPVGTLVEERTDSGETNYVSKHMVETLEDLKVYQYMCENTTYTPNIEAFVAREREIGDDGMATLTGNYSPVQELLQHMSGVENTVYLLADYPDEVEELFAVMQERNIRQYKALLEYPCDYIFDYEDTSTTVMNRTMFEDYSQPPINEYSDLVHSAGKVFITHMCGKLTGFVDLIGKGRQDGIDSVCPPDTGDLCPWDARKAWGEGKVVIGGIDPPSLVFMNRNETVEKVVEIIKKVENKRGFVLSTGDAVPYGTPVENLKVIADLIKAMGPASLTTDVDPELVKRFLK